MNLQGFGQFQNLANDSGVLLFYRGIFCERITEMVGEQLKSRLDSEGVKGPVKRKVFSTFVEMAQNVMHYGSPEPDSAGDADAKPGAVAMGIEEVTADAALAQASERRHWIVCANLVTVQAIPRISEKLQALQRMTLEEIKESYKRQLLNDDHSKNDQISKGAGLGLLTIARDSKAPLEFSFSSAENGDTDHAYFFVKAVI